MATGVSNQFGDKPTGNPFGVKTPVGAVSTNAAVVPLSALNSDISTEKSLSFSPKIVDRNMDLDLISEISGGESIKSVKKNHEKSSNPVKNQFLPKSDGLYDSLGIYIMFIHLTIYICIDR
jgi:hypothetical protein